MKVLFSLFLNASFWGSILIMVALVLRPFLRKAPRRILCVLWILVILRLLVPFHIESKLSLLPRFTPSQAITEQSVPQSDTPSIQLPAPDPTPNASPTPDVSPAPLPDVPPVQPESPAVKPAPDPVTVIAVVWLSIACAALLYNLLSYCALLHKIRASTPGADGALESDQIPGAFLLGYCRPKIYLPLGLSQQDRRFIIAHEKAHIRRGDNWWKLLGIICLCIHWYNPLVGLAYLLMCRDIEVACDERVVRDMPLEERKAYSMALLNCGKRMSGFFVASAAFGEISLKQRIKKVLTYRNPARWITVIGILLVVVTLVGFMTNPVQSPQNPTVQTPTDSTQATENTSKPADTETSEPSTESTATTTEPSNLQSDQTQNNTENVIVGGKWDGGPVTWKITADGVLTISGNRSVQASTVYSWVDYSDVVTKIVVEDGITTIPKDAFKGMDKVTEVYLGNKLETIGEKAFYQCAKLRSITIPASVKTISPYAFYDCRSLTNLQFAPACRIECIGSYAFAKTSISDFSPTVPFKEIGSYAFADCVLLQSVILNNGVERLGSKAFAGCTNIKHIVLSQSILAGGIGAFPDSMDVETMQIHCSVQGSTLANRTKLRVVVLGGSTTQIGSNFFNGCTSLSELTITAPITHINNRAFKGCLSLKSIRLPDTVTEIGIGAFSDCGIEKITIPATVNKMFWSVFSNSQVKEIVFMGDMPDFVNNSTFTDVTATIYYPAGNPTWDPDKLQAQSGNITWVAQ